MNKLLLSCEHAGNQVPEYLSHLFCNAQADLDSHVGYDPGALDFAEQLAKNLQAPLHYTLTSRLVIEANRSIGQPDHFSKYTKNLSSEEKKKLIELHYSPYRQAVEAEIRQLINLGYTVVHLSVHSFTPTLNNEKRSTDMGLLFDPGRNTEVQFCQLLSLKLQHLLPSSFSLDFNMPYLGVADGFTTYLRTLFSPMQYIGIELEVNQKYYFNNNNKCWQQLGNVFCQSMAEALTEFLV